MLGDFQWISFISVLRFDYRLLTGYMVLCFPAITYSRYCTCDRLTADETGGLKDLLFLLLFTTQVGKGVNNHTKDQVQYNDDDNKVEEKIIYYTCRKQRLLFNKCKKSLVAFCTSKCQSKCFVFYISSCDTLMYVRTCMCNLTFFEGLRRTSPTPPPFRRPWFSTVTIHINNVSHARSLLSSSAR